MARIEVQKPGETAYKKGEIWKTYIETDKQFPELELEQKVQVAVRGM